MHWVKVTKGITAEAVYGVHVPPGPFRAVVSSETPAGVMLSASLTKGITAEAVAYEVHASSGLIRAVVS